MKKLILALVPALLVVLFGIHTNSIATEKNMSVTEAECRYSVEDAVAGLKDLVPVDFIVHKKSDDGTKQIGMVVFHNPKSKNEKSVAAISLIVKNSEVPDMDLVLVVSYNQPGQYTTFKRKLANDGKSLDKCFSKTITFKKATDTSGNPE